MPLDMIVFDATFADVKGAATAGCSFCNRIVGLMEGEIVNDDLLLIADMFAGPVQFGTATIVIDDFGIAQVQFNALTGLDYRFGSLSGM